jgi:hypothetical protein
MCNSQKTLPVGDGDDPVTQLLGHLICLFTLIINIYGLGVGISTIIKFTSDRGWGMTARGLSYKAFNLPSHPEHKYANVKLCNQYFFIPGAQPHPAVESVLKNVTEIPTLNHIYL